jgi:diacylglycerol kinase (ATP)
MLFEVSSVEESPFKGKTGPKRVLNAFFYSVDGLKAALQHEDAFRQEMLLALVLIPLALYLEPSALGRVMMIASVLLVLIVELLNSAVEAAVDRISFEHHHLIKRAKDMGSAAVLVSLLNVVVVWGLILLG